MQEILVIGILTIFAIGGMLLIRHAEKDENNK